MLRPAREGERTSRLNIELLQYLHRQDQVACGEQIECPSRTGLSLGALLMELQELLQRRVDVVTEKVSIRPFASKSCKRRNRCEPGRAG